MAGMTIPGYYFGSGPQGIGYPRGTSDGRRHREAETAAANVPEQEAHNIAPPPKWDEKAEEVAPAPASDPTPRWIVNKNRRRHKGGKRIRASKPGTAGLPIMSPDLTHSSCSSKWAKDNGYCAIDSWNINSWYAGVDSAVTSTDDALLVQETKILDPEQCKRAEDATKTHGWQTIINKAQGTEKGGASAGVAVLGKKMSGWNSTLPP